MSVTRVRRLTLTRFYFCAAHSGTGSSAIYPLLACRQRPKWLFLATEIDDTNRNYASKNIAANHLQSRIKLLDTDMSGQQLIPSTELERFDRYVVLDLFDSPNVCAEIRDSPYCAPAHMCIDIHVFI